MESSVVKLPASLANPPDNEYVKEVWRDYYTCLVSREMSLAARKEVMSGKAKFGIVGDGKEVAQVAMARAFKLGDFRSGYYRDQTFVLAKGLVTIEEYFAQIYADPVNDTHTLGRQMSSHFATPFIDDDGAVLDLKNRYNISVDMAPTGGQVARAMGHALASKLFRQSVFEGAENLTRNGEEVSFCTIGDSSTSEGAFWETLNAAAVLKVPLAIAVWDDGYGISVPTNMQTVKGSISRALEGFLLDDNNEGIRIYVVKGWDYVSLVETFEKAIAKCRQTQTPCLIHVHEITQPQGHSTSGSHERYKSAERLLFEKEMDCIRKMGEWMLEVGLAQQEDLDQMREQAKAQVKLKKDIAWNNASKQSDDAKAFVMDLHTAHHLSIPALFDEVMKSSQHFSYAEILDLVKKYYIELVSSNSPLVEPISQWLRTRKEADAHVYDTHLYAEGKNSYRHLPVEPLKKTNDDTKIPGHQLLNQYFDLAFGHNPRLLAFGEDVGHIGDVNQGFSGLQSKYGDHRIFDCGIREWTIVGQAIGLAQRGFRPIAEIQYLDYLPYAMSPLMDDLATIRYRSGGKQSAPVIVRTRGHRLEGMWHAGSPMGLMLTSMPGIFILVPRDMTRAIGFYNTLLAGQDPAIIVECLNGYRIRESMIDNMLEFKLELGKPEILSHGHDITVVTYGSCVRIAQQALSILSSLDISIELIDAQTLQPFDTHGIILDSLKNTNKIIFMDEDVPGGASAYMMQMILERDKGFEYLESQPRTLTAKSHRTPYGTNGDYFTKPQSTDLVTLAYQMMKEINPSKYNMDIEILEK
jgi:pyruvate/2-oxoglutarate/acetoin dehydrogenase E1 component/TPP-dependent pyruvate/acetoin dehydrogenase alpha subunit